MIHTLKVRPAPSTAVSSRHLAEHVAPLVEQMAEEMIASWRSGEPRLVEEILERQPDLASDPEVVLELVAEELALRAEFDRPVDGTELADRFPQWAAQVAALVECQRVLGSPTLAPRFPSPDEDLGEFQLVSLLGRGSQGQVFLARQPSLADRPVVLKLGPSGSSEHLCLARLQHSHIVPLYSAHEYPELGLTGFCMPYFGGATLADILDRLEEPNPRLRTGRDVLDVLRRVESDLESAWPPSPALGFLDHASATEAVCWIGACLADALQYAHDRGLLHLDLKPSNVLIASDGTPMLLDFHLARPPLLRGEAAPSRLGGTVGYMPAEQVAALKAVKGSGAILQTVDARADVHALGVTLEEFRRILQGDRALQSTGLHDVLSHCTAPNPANRYATAGEVASDLRRHLADLPLRGVRNRSLAERWAKWRRRRPYAMPLALTLAALFLIALGMFIRAEIQIRRAELAQQAGDLHLSEHRYREASEAYHRGELLIDGVPGQSQIRSRLHESRLQAERAQAAKDLHSLCERIRPLYASDAVSTAQYREAARQCRTLWDGREAIVKELSFNGNQNWQRDLLDLGVLTAHFETRATPISSDESHRQALKTLDQAEAMLGPSQVLSLERSRHRQALGLEATNEPVSEPRTAWDYLLVGRFLLAEERHREALKALNSSLALEPQSLWANYYHGLCAMRLDQPMDALASFAVCVALAPESPWCIYNRSLANQKANRKEQAFADANRALELDPHFGVAYLNRASLHAQAGRTPQAFADLHQAETNGASVAEVRLRSALIHLEKKDRQTAIQRVRECLSADPNHSAARELLESLTK